MEYRHSHVHLNKIKISQVSIYCHIVTKIARMMSSGGGSKTCASEQTMS